VDVNVPSSGRDINDVPVSADVFFSPGWQNRKVPLYVTHDRDLWQAMSRDGWPVIYIPPTDAGVNCLVRAFLDEPARERPDDRTFDWLVPQDDPAGAAVARTAMRKFGNAISHELLRGKRGNGCLYRAHESVTWGAADYETRLAPDAAEFIESLCDEIKEERAAEREEFERAAKERRERLEREKQKAEIMFWGDFRKRSGPLYVATTDEAVDRLLGLGLDAVLISPTAGGAALLADALANDSARRTGADRDRCRVGRGLRPRSVREAATGVPHGVRVALRVRLASARTPGERPAVPAAPRGRGGDRRRGRRGRLRRRPAPRPKARR
jgi:hypothetical protein